ncbi:MAG TPA: palindromic element RPE1 domain-containing protein [Rickettsia endosymbiont of Sericostoma sp.]|nr:palindromic element RPE1 domain-containing protein [Rickettsia endosymbiont of Sericostoma sp. HW-2014]HJD64438.1 palindromic element RPE1 domain-containing protein [Rickettsia endosymbiont of Sericostoma sp.]
MITIRGQKIITIYTNVREEQSTGITHKLPAEVEFRKRSIDVLYCCDTYITKIVGYYA